MASKVRPTKHVTDHDKSALELAHFTDTVTCDKTVGINDKIDSVETVSRRTGKKRSKSAPSHTSKVRRTSRSDSSKTHSVADAIAKYEHDIINMAQSGHDIGKGTTSKLAANIKSIESDLVSVQESGKRNATISKSKSKSKHAKPDVTFTSLTQNFDLAKSSVSAPVKSSAVAVPKYSMSKAPAASATQTAINSTSTTSSLLPLKAKAN